MATVTVPKNKLILKSPLVGLLLNFRKKANDLNGPTCCRKFICSFWGKVAVLRQAGRTKRSLGGGRGDFQFSQHHLSNSCEFLSIWKRRRHWISSRKFGWTFCGRERAKDFALVMVFESLCHSSSKHIYRPGSSEVVFNDFYAISP